MMKKGSLLFVTMILGFCLLLTGCGGGTGATPETDAPSVEGETTAMPQELNVSINVEITDLNPLVTSTTDEHEVLMTCMETLVRMGEGGALEMGSGLAESWDISEDYLTYTFHLRDAKFSTGDPVTAQDFEYSWKKVLDPAMASEYAYLLYPIAGAEAYNTGTGNVDDIAVHALDEKTLEVTLVSPIDYFIDSLVITEFSVVPEGSVEEFGDNFFMSPEYMVFCGPYIMTEWVPNQYVVVEKNPNYWDADNVKLDKITFHMGTETNTIVNMFETGQLDVMQVQPEFLEIYKDYPNFVAFTEAVTEYLKFNFQDPFFGNKKIRQAFSMAIDRTSYMNDFFKTGSTPAYGYIPPGILGVGGKDFRDNNGDLYTDANHGNTPEQAAAMLDAGLAEIGKTREELSAYLSLVIGQGDLNLKTAQVLQEMWKNTLGVNLEVKSLQYAMRQAEYDSGEFTIGKEGWGADYNDPMTFLDLFMTSSPYNDLGYSNPDYDALLTQANQTHGDERMELLQQAEKILVEEDCAIAPTFFQTRSWVYKDYVHGVIRNGSGLRCDYKYAYVE